MAVTMYKLLSKKNLEHESGRLSQARPILATRRLYTSRWYLCDGLFSHSRIHYTLMLIPTSTASSGHLLQALSSLLRLVITLLAKQSAISSEFWHVPPSRHPSDDARRVSSAGRREGPAEECWREHTRPREKYCESHRSQEYMLVGGSTLPVERNFASSQDPSMSGHPKEEPSRRH
uniref:Uncharacterized protein n=2 Tax=Trichogramma kaykai TaxID=54128 RepID=A0ABD2WUG2_9HYME